MEATVQSDNTERRSIPAVGLLANYFPRNTQSPDSDGKQNAGGQKRQTADQKTAHARPRDSRSRCGTLMSTDIKATSAEAEFEASLRYGTRSKASRSIRRRRAGRERHCGAAVRGLQGAEGQ
jgi:hypothetical protein